MKITDLLLPLLVLAALLPVTFAPPQGEIKPSALSTTLPTKIGAWSGVSFRESQEERDTLARDTLFRKMYYIRKDSDHSALFNRVTCSVVFSGHDVNNSLHQPERCLPAQGHIDLQSSNITLTSELLPQAIPIKRLTSNILIHPNDPERASKIESLTYYFFVGHTALTNSHQKRTSLDIKDRVLKHYDQRWAFVMLTLPYGRQIHPSLAILDKEKAERILNELAIVFAAETVDWDQISP